MIKWTQELRVAVYRELLAIYGHKKKGKGISYDVYAEVSKKVFGTEQSHRHAIARQVKACMGTSYSNTAIANRQAASIVGWTYESNHRVKQS